MLTGWIVRFLAAVLVLACVIASYWIIIPLAARLIGIDLHRS